MFTRIVSLVTITAVFGCPMWCGSGPCSAGNCCVATQPTATGSPANCCHHSSPAATDDRNPDQSPEKLSCQGICGGAVFEKPCELGNQQLCCYYLPTDFIGVDTLTLSQRGGIIDREHAVSANQGRVLRAQCMSFLC